MNGDLIVHREHEHPARPGAYRWLMAPSGVVYWLHRNVDGSWEVFSGEGTTIVRSLSSLDAVRRWAHDSEEADV